jgi:hypothetical protein
MGHIQENTAAGELPHLVLVEAIPHPNLECAGDDRNVFAKRMPVGRDPVTVRHFQTHGEVTGGAGGIAFDYGELRPLGQ